MAFYNNYQNSAPGQNNPLFNHVSTFLLTKCLVCMVSGLVWDKWVRIPTVNMSVMELWFFIFSLEIWGVIRIAPRIGAILIGQKDIKIAVYWKLGMS